VLSSLMILVGGENRLVLGGCCGDRYSMHNWELVASHWLPFPKCG
jgi:hypothetical protein